MWKRRFEEYKISLRWFIYKHDKTITVTLFIIFVTSMLLMVEGIK